MWRVFRIDPSLIAKCRLERELSNNFVKLLPKGAHNFHLSAEPHSKMVLTEFKQKEVLYAAKVKPICKWKIFKNITNELKIVILLLFGWINAQLNVYLYQHANGDVLFLCSSHLRLQIQPRSDWRSSGYHKGPQLGH